MINIRMLNDIFRTILSILFGGKSMNIRKPKSSLLLILMCSVLFMNGIVAYPEDKYSEVCSEVVKKANAFTGFVSQDEELKISQESIQLIRLDDNTTPFIGEYGNNRAVWQISFSDINLKSIDGLKADNRYLRNFDVFIDSTTGKILKVSCYYDTPLPNECPELTAKVAEEQLEKVGEQYIEIPDDVPPISFSEAFLKCPVTPFNAKEITGQYVLYSDGIRKPRPMWIISLCGIPPRPQPSFPGRKVLKMPLYQRTRIRQLIDATTGSIFFTSTRPAVPRLPEDAVITGPLRRDKKNE